MLLYTNIVISLQNQNNINISKNKVNIYGVFDERKYDNFLVNNNTNITLYEKPNYKEGDPNLFQQTKSLVPNNSDSVYIKQIKYVVPEADELKKNSDNTLIYNKQPWHEIEITFSNNESKNYLVPASTQITMVYKVLNINTTMGVSRLIGDVLIIEGFIDSSDGDKKTEKK